MGWPLLLASRLSSSLAGRVSWVRAHTQHINPMSQSRRIGPSQCKHLFIRLHKSGNRDGLANVHATAHH